MTRVKRGKIAHKKREKILKQTKGFMWGRKSKEKAAKEALIHSLANSFRGRKEKKRTFRQLWNVRINAALRQRGSKYSNFIHDLKENDIELDRKILSQIAAEHPEVFDSIVDKVNKPKKEDGKNEKNEDTEIEKDEDKVRKDKDAKAEKEDNK